MPARPLQTGPITIHKLSVQCNKVKGTSGEMGGGGGGNICRTGWDVCMHLCTKGQDWAISNNSPLMAIFWDNRRVNWYQNANVLDFIAARTMEVLTAAIISAKLQSNRHHQQNQRNFLQAGCLFCCPTNSVWALKGESVALHELVYLKLMCGSSNLFFDH